MKTFDVPEAKEMYCFNCEEDTMQQPDSISVYSPGSYMGLRSKWYYKCEKCGKEGR